MADKPSAAVKGGALAAAAIAAAVTLAGPLTTGFEGLRTTPYRDPANIATVCYGETEREMRRYTPDECATLLRARQAADYAPPLVRCVPLFADRRHGHAFAASLDAAYNAGVVAFCRSPMARSFNAGRWAEGCDGFPRWYVTARVNGRPTLLRGLVRRRTAERALCLRDVA
jgi:lysozyme